MSASYPGAVKTFAVRNNGDTIQAAHIDDLQDEVTAIETGLLTGTAPISASNASFVHLNASGDSTLASSTLKIGTIPYIFPSSVPAACWERDGCVGWSDLCGHLQHRQHHGQ